jgi:hypothetical protein
MPLHTVSWEGCDDEKIDAESTRLPQELDRQSLAAIDRNRSIMEALRPQLRQQWMLARMSRLALAGLEPHRLLDEGVGLVVEPLKAQNSEVCQYLMAAGDA